MHNAIDYSAIPKLNTRISGAVINPGDEHYHEARRVWNGRIDKYPSLIVRCVDITDVLTTIEFARQWDMAVAVRSGGHSMVGNSVSDGGIVIDLSRMKGMWVDPVKSRAQAQAGLTLGEFVRQAQIRSGFAEFSRWEFPLNHDVVSACHDCTLVLSTPGRNQKVKNLLRDPRIALCVGDEARSVSLYGRVSISDDQALIRQDLEHLVERYVKDAGIRPQVSATFVQQSRVALH